MTIVTFKGVATDCFGKEAGVDVAGNHVAAALELFHKTFGANRKARISIVLMTETVAAKVDKSAEGLIEHGEAYKLCDGRNKALGVQIDICTMSPAQLSDQED